MLVIVDGDPIVYRAGFAGEDTEYHVVYQSPEGEPEYHIFSRTEDKTALKNLREWEESIDPECILDVEKVIIPEELDHVLATVRAMLRDTLYAAAEQFHCEVGDLQLKVLLSGPGNFRERLATIKPYKGNRKEDSKPHWYQQIRNYLTDQWDAEVIEGREADDECSILQKKHGIQCVVASIDKDLDQVPGHHYDYVRKTHYFTKPNEGEALFYKQVLSGDSTDNIPGAHKIGRARAAAIVDEYLLDNPVDYEGLWQRIVEVYEETLDKYGEACLYYDIGAEAAALETARLVKMQDYEGQLWNPPGVEDEILENVL